MDKILEIGCCIAVVLAIAIHLTNWYEVRKEIQLLNKTIKQNQHRESINDFIEKCKAAKKNGFGVAYSFNGTDWEICGEVWGE